MYPANTSRKPEHRHNAVIERLTTAEAAVLALSRLSTLLLTTSYKQHSNRFQLQFITHCQ